MFESKLFEEWLKEIEENRIKELLLVKELVAKFKKVRKEQLTYTVSGFDRIQAAIERNECEEYINWLKEEYKQCHIIPEMKNCSSWKITEEYKVHEDENYKTINCVINIDDKKIEDYLYTTGRYFTEKEKYNGLATYLQLNGLSITDANLIENRDEQWIIKRVKKENEQLRKALENKVKKICGEQIVEVVEAFELYLKGSNGRTAKLWTITAGGYNIQRLHTRVLCKEKK